MKTTLNLNDQLLADAKAMAAQQRTSLPRLVEEGLQLRLRRGAESPPRARVRLPVYEGRGGLVEGVGPLSNHALLEALGPEWAALRQLCLDTRLRGNDAPGGWRWCPNGARTAATYTSLPIRDV